MYSLICVMLVSTQPNINFSRKMSKTPEFKITPSSPEHNAISTVFRNKSQSCVTENTNENKSLVQSPIPNLDHLLNTYKKEQESIYSQRDPEENPESDAEVEEKQPIKKVSWKTAFSNSGSKEKKVKSLTIKSRHQQARETKTSKILMPVLQVSVPILAVSNTQIP